MSEWRVDPDGVLGVLAGIDDLQEDFLSAQKEIEEAASSGSSLSVEGRTVLSDAWKKFMERRSSVPGKVMYAVSAASSGLGNATMEIVTGNEEMALGTESTRQHAEDAWGILSDIDYWAEGMV